MNNNIGKIHNQNTIWTKKSFQPNSTHFKSPEFPNYRCAWRQFSKLDKKVCRFSHLFYAPPMTWSHKRPWYESLRKKCVSYSLTELKLHEKRVETFCKSTQAQFYWLEKNGFPLPAFKKKFALLLALGRGP